MSYLRLQPQALLPSLTDVVFLLPVVLLFGKLDGAPFLLADGDTGWHIRAGEWMLDHRQVPRRDLFSFSKPGEPWFAWEWLSDVVFGWLHRQAGLAAVVLAGVLLLALTFALLYRLARRLSGNPLAATAVTLVAVAGSWVHWLARPHLFTLLLVVIFCGLLERARAGEMRVLVWLPLWTVLWANLHGGFLAGILLIAAYAGGELAGALVAADGELRRSALDRGGRYAVAGVACLLASLVNPYTYHLHVHLYHYLVRDGYHLRHIHEFQSLNFHHPVAPYFEGLLMIGLAAAFWNVYRRRFVYALLILGWGHLALVSVRHMPIFLLVAAPIVAVAIAEWTEWLRAAAVAPWLRRLAAGAERLAAEIAETDRMPRLYAASAAGMVLLAALLYAPAPPGKCRAEFDRRTFPADAVGVLRAPDRVFALDQWGDYLIYRLYPRTRVFVDGRSDFYGPRFGEQYLDLLNVRYDWESSLRRYGIDTVLLPPQAPLAGTLKESSRWRTIYDDGVAIVFRAAAAGEPGRDREITKTLIPTTPKT